jgi:hypothetical protein
MLADEVDGCGGPAMGAPPGCKKLSLTNRSDVRSIGWTNLRKSLMMNNLTFVLYGENHMKSTEFKIPESDIELFVKIIFGDQHPNQEQREKIRRSLEEHDLNKRQRRRTR